MTSDHMLTTEQLEAIARSIRAGAVPGQDKLSALLRHVEALQQERRIHDKCVDDMSAMLDEESDRAEAAQKRAERLEQTLREVIDGLNEILMYREIPSEVEAFAKDYSRLARATLEDTGE